MLSTFNKVRKASLPLAIAMALGSTALVGVGTLSFPKPAQAFFCSNCSTIVQQLIDTIIRLEQLSTEISQLNDMYQNSAKMPDSAFIQLTGKLQELQALYNKSRALAGNIADFDSKFRAEYKDYDKYLESVGQNPGYARDQYERWNNESQDSIRTAMQHGGDQVGAMDDEDKLLKKLIDKSKGATGRMEAAQVGNEIAAQQVQQIQKLRQLYNADIQMKGQYYAQAIERQTVSDAFDKKFKSGTVKHDGSKGF